MDETHTRAMKSALRNLRREGGSKPREAPRTRYVIETPTYRLEHMPIEEFEAEEAQTERRDEDERAQERKRRPGGY
jgi:hypothetical protein